VQSEVAGGVKVLGADYLLVPDTQLMHSGGSSLQLPMDQTQMPYLYHQYGGLADTIATRTDPLDDKYYSMKNRAPPVLLPVLPSHLKSRPFNLRLANPVVRTTRSR
jgi:hypothetical protein